MSVYISEFMQFRHVIISSCLCQYSDNNHLFKTFMESKNFKQLVEEPTHLEGHIIDHVYANQSMLKFRLNIFQKPVIFSDHDELFIRIN